MLGMLHRMLHFNPKLGVAERTGLLVAAAGPYFPQLHRDVARAPLGGLAVRLAAGAANAALASAPVHAAELAADSWVGDGLAPGTVRQRQRVLLAAGAAGAGVGVASQAALARMGGQGLSSEVARVMAAELTIASVGSMLIVGSDALLGPTRQASLSHVLPGVTVGSVIAAAQVAALRRIAPVISAETPSRPHRIRGRRPPR